MLLRLPRKVLGPDEPASHWRNAPYRASAIGHNTYRRCSMAYPKTVAGSYKEADESLQGRNFHSRKISNNTYLERRNGAGSIALHYHATDVVVYRPNGDMELYSGGWRTPTTKERINWALPQRWYLTQEKGVWWLVSRETGQQGFVQEHVFTDGITLHPDGTVTGAGTYNAKVDRAIKKRVKAYAQLCADAVPMDSPDGGDCWYCHLGTVDGKSLGDATGNVEHIDSHMEEGYVVPSLVFHALQAHYNANMAFWQAFKGDHSWGDCEFGRQAVKKAVYRYVLRRKGFAA